MELMQANAQWATRPDDERFTSLYDMRDMMKSIKDVSRERVMPSKRIDVHVEGKDVVVQGRERQLKTTNWSFGQLAQLAGAPAGYLRTLPPEMAADCINYGMTFNRDVREVGVLWSEEGHDSGQLRAATGPGYGRIWNHDIVTTLSDRFGDGVTGEWRVPGVWGQQVKVNKDNTTLYASDRDMFVFLANEEARIEVPNRRMGRPGSLARGFFVWNSEVGSKTFGIAMFLFDFVCANRIVWGATQYKEVKMRHTSGAPDRFADQIQPILRAYAQNATDVERHVIEQAQSKKIDDVEAFLQRRLSRKVAERVQSVHVLEEQRPIETLWDATTAITAYARNMAHQDERVEMERIGGAVLELAGK